MKGARVFFAIDIHGSDRCFRKFLNAAKFYRCQVLIMGVT
jgi:Icc-related predicted phosphoesterase